VAIRDKNGSFYTHPSLTLGIKPVDFIRQSLDTSTSSISLHICWSPPATRLPSHCYITL